MTGRNTPSPDSVLHILAEADVEQHPKLVRAVEDIASLAGGAAPDACAELAQLMADGGRGARSRRTKGRITYIGGALAVSMGVGMSGVAAETVHLHSALDGAVDSISGFTTRDGVTQAGRGPVPAVGAPPARSTGSPSDGGDPASAPTAAPAMGTEPGQAPSALPSAALPPVESVPGTSSSGSVDSSVSAPGVPATAPGVPIPDPAAAPAHDAGTPDGMDAEAGPRIDAGASPREATDGVAPGDGSTVQASAGFAVWLWEAQRPERARFAAPSAEWLGEPGADPGVVTLLAGPVTVDAEWLTLFLAEIEETPVDGPTVKVTPDDTEDTDAPGELSPDAEVSGPATPAVEKPVGPTPGADGSDSVTPGADVRDHAIPEADGTDESAAAQDAVVEPGDALGGAASPEESAFGAQPPAPRPGAAEPKGTTTGDAQSGETSEGPRADQPSSPDEQVHAEDHGSGRPPVPTPSSEGTPRSEDDRTPPDAG